MPMENQVKRQSPQNISGALMKKMVKRKKKHHMASISRSSEVPELTWTANNDTYDAPLSLCTRVRGGVHSRF